MQSMASSHLQSTCIHSRLAIASRQFIWATPALSKPFITGKLAEPTIASFHEAIFDWYLFEGLGMLTLDFALAKVRLRCRCAPAAGLACPEAADRQNSSSTLRTAFSRFGRSSGLTSAERCLVSFNFLRLVAIRVKLASARAASARFSAGGSLCSADDSMRFQKALLHSIVCPNPK